MARQPNEAMRQAIIALRQAEPVNPSKHEWVRNLADIVIQVTVIGLIIASIIGMCAIAAMSYYSGPVR